MADLESAKFDQKIESLKAILYQIVLNTTPNNNNISDTGDIDSNEAIITYMPLLYGSMLNVASGLSSMNNQTAKVTNSSTDDTQLIALRTQNISTNTNDIVELMKSLSNAQLAVSDTQEDYLSDLVANSQDFVDYTEEDKKKGNILSRLAGTVKGAVSGFISGLFAPKPKVVILAKSTIKDIAGVIKAFSPENKASFKDKVKDKAAGSVADALSTVINKVGNAIKAAVKSIEIALNIFIYVIFPLVLLGAVAVLVVGLYFIAKMVLDYLGNAIVGILESIADSVKIVATAWGGFIDNIGKAISTAIMGVKDVLLAPFNLIETAITTLGNILKAPLESIAKGVESVLTAIGPAIGEVISSLSQVISANVEKFGLIIEGVGNGINLIVGIAKDIWGYVKVVADKLISLISPGSVASAAVSTIGSFFGFGKDDKNNQSQSTISFNDITDPICQSIKDFANMVQGYLANIKIGNAFNTVRTNIAGNGAISTFNNNGTDSYSYSYDSNVSNNRSSNVSRPSDGSTNQAFNNATATSNYSYNYDNNVMNGQNNNNAEVVSQIKQTNELLVKLIEAIGKQSTMSNFSMVGD